MDEMMMIIEITAVNEVLALKQQNEISVKKIKKYETKKKYEQNALDQTYEYKINQIIIILFIVGILCYFSGNSKMVGGRIFKHINVTVTKLCNMNNDDDMIDIEPIISKQINGDISCNVKTGYYFDSSLDCNNKLSDKYYIGSNHSVYYDSFNKTCMTYSEANTISFVGFLFLVLTAVLVGCKQIFKTQLKMKIINNERKINKIQDDILRINCLISSEKLLIEQNLNKQHMIERDMIERRINEQRIIESNFIERINNIVPNESNLNESNSNEPNLNKSFLIDRIDDTIPIESNLNESILIDYVFPTKPPTPIKTSSIILNQSPKT